MKPNVKTRAIPVSEWPVALREREAGERLPSASVHVRRKHQVHRRAPASGPAGTLRPPTATQELQRQVGGAGCAPSALGPSCSAAESAASKSRPFSAI